MLVCPLALADRMVNAREPLLQKTHPACSPPPPSRKVNAGAAGDMHNQIDTMGWVNRMGPLQKRIL
jgi:hypothetical protein